MYKLVFSIYLPRPRPRPVKPDWCPDTRERCHVGGGTSSPPPAAAPLTSSRPR